MTPSAGQLQGGSQTSPEAAVGMLAGVTTAGTVELVTLQRGLLQPLHASISASIGPPNGHTSTLHWLDDVRYDKELGLISQELKIHSET